MSRMNRVYIGRLPYQAREKDVERFFRGFGRIRDINLKNGFGFVVSVLATSEHCCDLYLRNLMIIVMQMMLYMSYMVGNY